VVEQFPTGSILAKSVRSFCVVVASVVVPGRVTIVIVAGPAGSIADPGAASTWSGRCARLVTRRAALVSPWDGPIESRLIAQ